jgi:hypothetical protein
VRQGRFTGGRVIAALAGGLLLLGGGSGRADDKTELRAIFEAQAKELAALKAEIEKRQAALPPACPAPVPDDAVKKIVAQYLKDNPGAGMPNGVQTGYKLGQGFSVASPPSPNYANWDDDSKIPFELRFKARIQVGYYGYKVTDRVNHQTNLPATQTNLTGVIPPANTNTTRLADFSQLEAKRMNFVWEGTVFDPDLRYHFELLGSTRGLPGLQNNKVVQTSPAGGTAPNGAAVSPIGGGILLDHAVTLFEAWVAYDIHLCACEKGCGPDCPHDQWKYCPTLTLLVGKIKPFFGLDEFLRNSNMQFVDFSMADLYFDADDDTRLMAAGIELRALENRFFLQSVLTNGNEGTLQPNAQMDNLPGFITGFWYDLGGRWNPDKKAWDLYGDCISDIDYSCCPVVRAGGCVDLVPMNRRSLYGDAEQSRVFVMPAAPGGTRLINELNGDLAGVPGTHNVDMFDYYCFNAFLAGKYRGFSVCNEWWLRTLNNFRTTPAGHGDIIYQDTLGPGGAFRNALFPANHALVDYGFTLQAGYFLIPRKLEVAARWSWIRGESGDINGNGTFTTVTVPGVAGPVQVVNGAFRQFHEADEYTVGVNYFFRRHNLKWQTDFGVYQGGNPAAGGSPVACFVPGADGYLIRTQIQMLF